jgi:hypothetical protein
LSVKEQALRQLVRVHNDDDDDDDDDVEVFVKRGKVLSFQTCVRSECCFIPTYSTRSNGDVFIC